MKIETYKCDVCGVTKEQSNGWWQIGIQTEPEVGIHVPFLYLNKDMVTFADDHLVKVFDLCGASCVQRKVAEFMEKVSA